MKEVLIYVVRVTGEANWDTHTLRPLSTVRISTSAGRLGCSSTLAPLTHGSAASCSQKLSIKPTKERNFKTVDRRILKRQIGEAVIDYAGERVTAVVVFGEEGDEEVLGVHTLEGMGMEFDPVANELRKVEAILAV